MNSSAFGAFAYPLLGRQPGQLLQLRRHAPPPTPPRPPAPVRDLGPLCHSPNPEDCGDRHRRPGMPWSRHAALPREPAGQHHRGVSHRRRRQRDRLGGRALRGSAAVVVVLPDSCDQVPRRGHERLAARAPDELRVPTEPRTADTTVIPAAATHRAYGSYTSLMTMSSVTAQRNTALVKATHHPGVIRYQPARVPLVDPAHIAEGTNPTAVRLPDPARPWQGEFNVRSLGRHGEVEALDPTPVVVTAEKTVPRSRRCGTSSCPTEWAQLLDSREVFFEIQRDGTPVAGVAGSQGAFTHPAGLPFPPGTRHTAHLRWWAPRWPRTERSSRQPSTSRPATCSTSQATGHAGTHARSRSTAPPAATSRSSSSRCAATPG